MIGDGGEPLKDPPPTVNSGSRSSATTKGTASGDGNHTALREDTLFASIEALHNRLGGFDGNVGGESLEADRANTGTLQCITLGVQHELEDRDGTHGFRVVVLSRGRLVEAVGVELLLVGLGEGHFGSRRGSGRHLLNRKDRVS